MTMKRLFLAIICSTGLLFQMTSTQAGSTPAWSIIPMTATTISVPADQSALVNYCITNNSSRPHSLVMNSPNSSYITQRTDSSPGTMADPVTNCGQITVVTAGIPSPGTICSSAINGNAFTLLGQQSCVLVLLVNPNSFNPSARPAVGQSVRGAVTLCDTISCNTTSGADNLNVTFTTPICNAMRNTFSSNFVC